MVSFEEFMAGLSDTNATLGFFTDFDKVSKNISKISMKLNQLNYLIGKPDMKKAVYELYDENSKAFEVLDILIAIRNKDKKKVIDENGEFILVEEYFKSPDKIYEYIKETGLEKVFMTKEIKNLVDYVFGVEVGLDTNARKNRTGKFMEKAVATLFEKNNIPYKREVYATEFPELISLGEDLKRFDFAIKTPNKTYLLEVNFYSSGGSKLNETARSYTDISPKINQYEKYEFVWITDGKGWEKAKSKLKEAYQNIDKIYNLQTIKEFINLLKNELK